MCTGEECKNEFSCRALGLEYDRPTDFGLSQFGKKSLVYVIYRWMIGLFFLVSLFYGFGSYPPEYVWWKWLIFLTHWGFAVLTTATLLGAVISLHVYLRIEGDGSDKINVEMPLGYKVYWVFHNMSLGAAPLISVIYWVTVYDPEFYDLNYPSLTFHAVNIGWTVIDFFFSAVPVRILHAFHGVCFGAVYTIFALIYWQAGGTDERANPYIYSVIDFENEPTKSAVWIIALFGFEIVLHIIWFGLYRLRLALYRCCTQDRSVQPTTHANYPL